MKRKLRVGVTALDEWPATTQPATQWRPKAGDTITYTAADQQLTGLILDRAAWWHHGYDTNQSKWRTFDHGCAVWVHRGDGTFDKVAVTTKGPNKGHTHWLGQHTASGILTSASRKDDMATPATFARLQYQGDRTPDHRTATCEKHKPCSPTTDTAQGDGVQLTHTEWTCVVCPLPDADLLGSEVMISGYGASTYVYGGAHEHRSGVSITYDTRGGPNIVNAAVTDVAPAGTPTDPKDPRITVVKLPGKRDYQDAGVWLPAIDFDGLRDRQWKAYKSKRDALAWAASKLAIAEYHQARAAKLEEPAR